MIRKLLFIATMCSLASGILSPEKASAMLPPGNDTHRHFYKDQEWAPAMREFLGAYQKEFGEPMAFVRLECASFQIREWLPRYLAAAEVFHSLGVGRPLSGPASR